jgi:hypothetical protein
VTFVGGGKKIKKEKWLIIKSFKIILVIILGGELITVGGGPELLDFGLGKLRPCVAHPLHQYRKNKIR